MYLLALIFPPLAVLFCGKPIQALINFVLLFLLWVPAVIHAIMIVSAANADKRNKELIAAVKSQDKIKIAEAS